jgi:hypothetical protein
MTFDVNAARRDPRLNRLAFEPYIPDRYGEGFGTKNRRVLLLGESHYFKEPQPDLRSFTRREVQPCADATVERTWGNFYRRLDKVLTQSEHEPSLDEAAKAWQRVAFSNTVQHALEPGARPKSEEWETASEAFTILLDVLQPHVVLVLGRQNWNHTPNDPGARENEGVGKKNVWRYAVGDGAFASWLYHPSRPALEDAIQGIATFRELLRRAEGAAS